MNDAHISRHLDVMQKFLHFEAKKLAKIEEQIRVTKEVSLAQLLGIVLTSSLPARVWWATPVTSCSFGMTSAEYR